MAKCPSCGVEVEKPEKTWELKGGRAKKTIVIGMFLCPKCNKKFRSKSEPTPPS